MNFLAKSIPVLLPLKKPNSCNDAGSEMQIMAVRYTREYTIIARFLPMYYELPQENARSVVLARLRLTCSCSKVYVP